MKNKVFFLLWLFPGLMTANFTVHYSFEDYLNKHPEKPTISLGTGHFSVQNISKSPMYNLRGIDQYKMPEHTFTHETSYVINLDSDMNPDLEGNIIDSKVWEYLLQEGRGKVYLIWEEHMHIDALAKMAVNQYAYDL